MSEKNKFTLARLFLTGGAIISAIWCVASLLSLFDVVEHSARWYEVVQAFGPLGIVSVVAGGTLCGWDLAGMKKRVE